ncbi:MAG: TetR/AcrR family transcriptional regulator, partial [Phycisphaerales bacterium]|nr:TetR/AcrR family transcriptional regulator [Phycisphaerales bacterium]
MEQAAKSIETRQKLVDAALYIIRLKGYSATTVDDICNKAGLTKGSFFHHFASKQDLAVAAATYFGEMGGGPLRVSPLPDPAKTRWSVCWVTST